jgi:hypothetical protein
MFPLLPLFWGRIRRSSIIRADLCQNQTMYIFSIKDPNDKIYIIYGAICDFIYTLSICNQRAEAAP